MREQHKEGAGKRRLIVRSCVQGRSQVEMTPEWSAAESSLKLQPAHVSACQSLFRDVPLSPSYRKTLGPCRVSILRRSELEKRVEGGLRTDVSALL